MLAVATSGGVLHSEFREVQRQTAATARELGRIVDVVSALDKKHEELRGDYRSAIVGRDQRVKNDDERQANLHKRLDALERRVFGRIEP
jgi:hypothetical protein